MSSYKNHQSTNVKHTKDRYDINNPEFNSTIKVKTDIQIDSFIQNLQKYIDFVSWGRWSPDLFWDLITPETGGIRLDLDQRIFLRCLSRFISNYKVFPRGYG